MSEALTLEQIETLLDRKLQPFVTRADFDTFTSDLKAELHDEMNRRFAELQAANHDDMVERKAELTSWTQGQYLEHEEKVRNLHTEFQEQTRQMLHRFDLLIERTNGWENLITAMRETEETRHQQVLSNTQEIRVQRTAIATVETGLTGVINDVADWRQRFQHTEDRLQGVIADSKEAAEDRKDLRQQQHNTRLEIMRAINALADRFDNVEQVVSRHEQRNQRQDQWFSYLVSGGRTLGRGIAGFAANNIGKLAVGGGLAIALQQLIQALLGG